jgi:hypothetical protein
VYPDGCSLLHYAAFARAGGDAGGALGGVLHALLARSEELGGGGGSVPLLARWLDLRNHAGATALHLLARAPLLPLPQRANAMAMLLAAGADPLAPDANRQTPLEALAASIPPEWGVGGFGGGGGGGGGGGAGMVPAPLLPFALSPDLADCVVEVPARGGGAGARGATRFNAHRVVLAASSTFFSAALSIPWRRGGGGGGGGGGDGAPTVALPLLEGQADTARRALLWCYCHSLRELALPPGEAAPALLLLHAADALGMEALKGALGPHLGALVAPRNVEAVFESAVAVPGCARLAVTAARAALAHFAAVAPLTPAPTVLLDRVLDFLRGDAPRG